MACEDIPFLFAECGVLCLNCGALISLGAKQAVETKEDSELPSAVLLRVE